MMNHECRKPTLVIYELTTPPMFTLIHQLFCQYNNLTCASTVGKEGVFKVNALPICLLPAMGRNERQDRVECRLANNRQEAQLINSTSQTVGHQYYHAQAIHTNPRIDGLRHEDTITIDHNEQECCKHQKVHNRDPSLMHLFSVWPVQRQATFVREGRWWWNQV